jgi:hypothetical protein
MCKFFSFVTNPDHDKDFYYFDWQMRQSEKDGADSHSHICAHFKLNEDKCNKYEYNPLAKKFAVDMQNAEHDDRIRAKRWVESLDWKLIVKPLVVKPIVNPFDLPKIEHPTKEQIGWLTEWASVSASVRASAWASVRASAWDTVWDSAWASVWDSVLDFVLDFVLDSVLDFVLDSVWAYISSFFAIEYRYELSSTVKLWEAGLVPSFDGKTWRLHSGKYADVVYEWRKGQE